MADPQITQPTLGSGGGTGTVTSVDLSLPAFLTVSGNPITTSGTLTAVLATQAANKIFAGPTTGADAAPTFRSLVAADIPDISATYVAVSGLGTGVATLLTQTPSGTGGLVGKTSPTLTTPVLGAATATSLALGGATIGTDALGVTGTSTFNGLALNQGTTGTSPGWYSQLTGDTVPRVRVGLNTSDIASIGFGAGGASVRDLFIERAGAANLRIGAPDAAAPVAQTLGVQNVVAGTSNTAGAITTIRNSAGTGTGVGGNIVFQYAPHGSTGTAQNAFATALAINGDTALLGFGGLTSSFPGLILSGTTLKVRLADNSADANFSAAQINASAAIITTSDVRAGSANWLYWNSRGVLQSPADGVVRVTKNDGTTGGAIQTPGVTVANLIAAATAGAGARAFVTDASTTVILGLGTTVAGGGSNKVPVYSDGTNWIYG